MLLKIFHCSSEMQCTFLCFLYNLKSFYIEFLFCLQLVKTEEGEDYEEPRILNHTVGIMGNINIQNEANTTVQQPLILDSTRLLEFHNVTFTPVTTTVSHPNTSIDADCDKTNLVKEMSASIEKAENLITFQPKESTSASSNYSAETPTSTGFTQSDTYGYQNFD